jgi:hypothetical protein
VEVAAQRDTLDGRVVGVAFAPPESTAVFERNLNLGVPILCDPDRTAYRLFLFGRTPWRGLLHPTFWWRALVATMRGRRLRVAQEDPMQLGGDVVLDSALRLRWIFRSRFPADRPTVSTVRSELAAAGDAGSRATPPSP